MKKPMVERGPKVSSEMATPATMNQTGEMARGCADMETRVNAAARQGQIGAPEKQQRTTTGRAYRITATGASRRGRRNDCPARHASALKNESADREWSFTVGAFVGVRAVAAFLPASPN
jgi:hypothetical protein